MAWVIERQTEDDNTIFEVYVKKNDLREEFGDRLVPASAVADTLDCNDKQFHCKGYELTEMSHPCCSYRQEVYIFTCTCDTDCTPYTMMLFVNYWIDRLKRDYY